MTFIISYMFHGGTSFGFTAGTNIFTNRYAVCPTSYDYDAPLDEAGDPTPKYFAIRKTISKYLPLPAGKPPVAKPKMKIDPIKLQFIQDIFEFTTQYRNKTKNSVTPMTFEVLNQPNGFVMYQTVVTVQPTDPVRLCIPGLRDRALIYIDNKYAGTLSRETNNFDIPINVLKGQMLQLLVENQGRICFGAEIGELKGIVGPVKLGPTTLTNWSQTGLPLHDPKVVKNLFQRKPTKATGSLTTPGFYSGSFVLPKDQAILHTYLQPANWRKGLVFLNEFNLGRYWPNVGPQVTLFAPANLFKPYPQENKILVFETELAPCSADKNDCTIRFIDHAIINATVPLL